jgi:hypothetical protein
VLAVLTGAYLLVRLQVLGALARPLPSSPALPVALASIPHVVLTYLRMALLPIDLAVLSPVRPVSAWLGARAALALGARPRGRRRRRLARAAPARGRLPCSGSPPGSRRASACGR